MTRAKVNSEGLKIHTAPRDSSDLVDELQFGDEVRVVYAGGFWAEVIVTHTKTGIGVGERGWCAKQYLTDIPGKPPDVPEPPHARSFDFTPLIVGAVLMAAIALVATLWTVPV